MGDLDDEGLVKWNSRCQEESASRYIRRARANSRNYPVSPRSLEDITIPSQYLTTAYGQPLLLWDSQYTQEKRRSFLFGTPDHVGALREAQHMVVDGTFKSAPHLFTQMVGVHGLFEDNWHLPLTFGLLPGKAEALYEDFFLALESFGPFDFQSVLCDYEKGLRNAILTVWPSTTLRGCYFHFTKATFKHLVDLGLKSEYEVEGSDIRKWYKIISALPFLPEDEVKTGWNRIRPLLPSDLAPFAAYFEYTWVGTSSSPPLFSIQEWNQFDASQMHLPSSTNMAEGWHHGFSSMLSCTNPSLWRFLEALKKEQNLTRMKLSRMRMMLDPATRAAKWRRYDDRLERLCNSFDQDTDILEYLKKFSLAV